MKHLLCSLSFAAIAAFAHAADFSQAGYWQAKDSPRVVTRLNTDWTFSLDGFKTSRTVVVPHSIDEGRLGIEASGNVNLQQPAWYRRTLNLSAAPGRRRFLHFEGVMGKSRFTFNGKELFKHFGGYLPVNLEITDLVRPGENTLEVWCDNSDDASFPPGKPQTSLDFVYFGGLYRDVYLVETGPVYFTTPTEGGVYVTTRREADGEWTLEADAKLGGPDPSGRRWNAAPTGETNGVTVKYLFDGAPVTLPHRVKNPALWTPETPALHKLTAIAVLDGKVSDSVDVRFGFRDLKIDGNGLTLNGQPYRKLVGVNRHQDFAFIGMALPNSLHWRDAKKFRDAGFNCIRSAHYPQDPAFLDACDELGLFIIDATPGWQFWNKQPEFERRVLEDIGNMVRRDRSRPSVFLYEPVLNETYYPASFARAAAATVRENCGGRTPSATDIVQEATDAYEVWYRNGRGWKTEPPNTQPQFIREFGDFVGDWNAQISPSRVSRDWGEAPMIVQADHYLYNTHGNGGFKSLLEAPPQLFGGCLWHGTDHARGYCPDNFLGGLVDYVRRRKYSWYAAKSMLNPEPMAFVANALEPYSPQVMRIYSNCTYKVEWLGKEYKEGETLDRSRWRNHNGSRKQGGMKITLANGKTKMIKPAHRFAGFLVTLDTEGLQPVTDGSDLVVCTAAAADAEGNIRRYHDDSVRFEVKGPADIVGTNPQHLRFGEASVLLRLRKCATPQEISVKAMTVREGQHGPWTGELWFTPGKTKMNRRIGVGAPVSSVEVERQQEAFGQQDAKSK